MLPVTGRLAGRVALITGTAGGQGAAAATLFADAGATVVGCDVKEAPGVAQVDLTDEDAVRVSVDAAAEEHGGIDVLYANAGATRFNAVDDVSAQEWDFVLRHELDVVFFPVRHAWKHVRRRPHAVPRHLRRWSRRRSTRLRRRLPRPLGGRG